VDAKIRVDPRELLSTWANSSDEWVRYIVRQVFAAGSGLSREQEEYAYALLRQEKSLDVRELSPEEPLATVVIEEDKVEKIAITTLSQVSGVNALASGGVIEPHEGLTILFGENGTGKTGYSRIFKSLAGSRTADVILGNITATEIETQSAVIEYKLGTEAKTFEWTGQTGVAPFTRMSIFDSPSVSFHVDDDLEYVYVPAALALFNHVIAGIKAVQVQVSGTVEELRAASTGLLARFSRQSSVYPLIETLGAATDLEGLEAAADSDPNVGDRISDLRRTVAALEADTLTAQIKVQQRYERVLAQGLLGATTLRDFDVTGYSEKISKLEELESDYRAFRAALFEAADLPTEPEDTWSEFVGAGETYKAHLIALDVHDTARCIYCRQSLDDSARALVGKYSEYLEDKIATSIATLQAQLTVAIEPLSTVDLAEVGPFLSENEGVDDVPAFTESLQRTLLSLNKTVAALRDFSEPDQYGIDDAIRDSDLLARELESTRGLLADLRTQFAARVDTLAKKKKALVELEAAAELSKSWALIEKQVLDAKHADRLTILSRPMPSLLRAVTQLAKTASDQMINESFDTLFAEEVKALRAPALNVEYVGRQGRAQRRKVLSGKHKPSTILSEGEQKVLAMADFLAEARLAGITAPVIFDDPVSSLDHRRIREVSERIVSLVETTQVIVFTHDILFASTLLALMEATKRCFYYQITDEEGKGQVTRASGPRWDTLSNLKSRINETIQTAKGQEGESRDALVRSGYSWIRSWCEVFAETELLEGVTQRYQPNVRMSGLTKIKTSAFPAVIEPITRIFDDACRFIEGHSQPLASQGVSPTLRGLEAHWAELCAARDVYLAAKA
jgi:hypothetical protein